MLKFSESIFMKEPRLFYTVKLLDIAKILHIVRMQLTAEKN